jgi:hypothetical protein
MIDHSNKIPLTQAAEKQLKKLLADVNPEQLSVLQKIINDEIPLSLKLLAVHRCLSAMPDAAANPAVFMALGMDTACACDGRPLTIQWIDIINQTKENIQ